MNWIRWVACAVRTGFAAYELPEIFGAPADEGENDAARDLIRLQAELLNDEILDGKIATYDRPIGGGDVIVLKPGLWELDDPLDRMAVASLNLEHWTDAQAELTHRIFVDEQQFNTWAGNLLLPESYSPDDALQIDDPFGRSRKETTQSAANNQPGDNNQSADKFVAADLPGVVPKLLKLPAVLDMVSLSRSSLYGRIAEKTFPEQTKIGGGSFWLQSEIMQWIEENTHK